MVQEIDDLDALTDTFRQKEVELFFVDVTRSVFLQDSAAVDLQSHGIDSLNFVAPKIAQDSFESVFGCCLRSRRFWHLKTQTSYMSHVRSLEIITLEDVATWWSLFSFAG